MTDAANKALTSAVLRILRPLVRILLRHGISFGTFADLAKAVFVDVADKEFGLPGRKQTISRVSVLTGLTRKEVVRLQGLGSPEDAVAERRYNRAARVVAGWVRDVRFGDGNGEPAALPFEGAENSFSELVRAYSGDVPPRAILDEMERVGVVERAPDGAIRLRMRAFVPQTGDEDKLHILGTDVAFLVGTIEHNLHPAAVARFQRKVAYDNLPSEVIPQLQALSREKGQQLIEEMDRWLSQQDRDINPRITGTGRKHAGLGIYYFEEDVPEENKP